MNTASQRNIGAFIAAVTCVLPQAASAAVDGSSIDRFAHNLPLSCVIHQAVGAETGSPSGVSVVTKLQHSQDDSTWSDYVQPGDSSVIETAALTAVNTQNSVAVDLSSAYRYIRPVTTPTFTGGTSPTIEAATTVILGGEALAPAA